MSSAIISPCGTYRYTLTRRIPCMLRWIKPLLLVMLNPSKATAEIDDPTIRRCIGFATAWYHTSLTVVNMFALRATDPSELLTHPDPFGPENEKYIDAALAEHCIGTVVVAWGAHALVRKRASPMMRKLSDYGVQCLGTTKDGSPKHPLYVPAAQQLVPWKMAA
jgi:hypothetical protein